MEFKEQVRAAVKEKARSKRFAFLLLAIAICSEVMGAICLKACAGFTVLAPSIATVIGYGLSIGLLVKILQHLPLGLVYGIWGGVGSAATMLVGVLVWGDPFTLLTGVGLVLIVSGCYLLNKGTDEIEAAKAQRS